RCREFMAASDGKSQREIQHPCPFLEGDRAGSWGRCSVYEVRPLACRGYHSLDLRQCQRLFDHPEDHSVQVDAWGAPITVDVMTAMGSGLMLNGLDGRPVKLAHAILIALGTPDAAERYLAGEGVFDEALTPIELPSS